MQIVKNLKSELTCIYVKKYGLLQPYRVLSFISISINFLINSLIIYFPSQFTTWLTRKFLISTFVERRRNLLEMHQFFTYFFVFRVRYAQFTILENDTVVSAIASFYPIKVIKITFFFPQKTLRIMLILNYKTPHTIQKRYYDCMKIKKIKLRIGTLLGFVNLFMNYRFQEL